MQRGVPLSLSLGTETFHLGFKSCGSYRRTLKRIYLTTLFCATLHRFLL